MKLLMNFGRIFFGIIFVSSCKNSSETLIGEYETNSEYVKAKMELYSDSTYYFKFPINHIESDTIDFYEHKGTWRKLDNVIELNSFRRPTNFHLIHIKESKDSSIENGSIYIKTTAAEGCYFENGDSIFPFLPESIELNRKKYNFRNDGTLETKFENLQTILLHGYLTDYPKYDVKDKQANKFVIKIKIPSSNGEIFHPRSYFVGEKLLIEGSGLVFEGNFKFIKIR